MTVKELIEKLQELPSDAEVFHGIMTLACDPKVDGFELYDFDVTHYNAVRSYRSSSNQYSIKADVVVLEYV
jgi:hypothetical protein